MYLLAVCFSHIRLKWLLRSSQWWLYKVLLHCQEVFRSLTSEKRQQQTKGASALCHLRVAAKCTLNPFVRNPRDEVGKPQFEQKIQWSKQNVISLPFSFFFFFPFLTLLSCLGGRGRRRKTDLNRIRSPPNFIYFQIQQGQRGGCRRSCGIDAQPKPCRRAAFGVVLWEIAVGLVRN